MVSPNGAGVWGFKTFPKLQTIQNKANRHVMGVGKCYDQFNGSMLARSYELTNYQLLVK